jgi:hypothetical protein
MRAMGTKAKRGNSVSKEKTEVLSYEEALLLILF